MPRISGKLPVKPLQKVIPVYTWDGKIATLFRQITLYTTPKSTFHSPHCVTEKRDVAFDDIVGVTCHVLVYTWSRVASQSKRKDASTHFLEKLPDLLTVKEITEILKAQHMTAHVRTPHRQFSIQRVTREPRDFHGNCKKRRFTFDRHSIGEL